jgi:hypothetical protein
MMLSRISVPTGHPIADNTPVQKISVARGIVGGVVCQKLVQKSKVFVNGGGTPVVVAGGEVNVMLGVDSARLAVPVELGMDCGDDGKLLDVTRVSLLDVV